ncbi:hypothetical protein MAR_038213 [Mya arenaria]|uniref:Copper transporter n=1 Tax=Mya arenaria TaxID=6604 RepID=A0ABY7FUJ9_MYAAR|nr:probable low affinity copper uptake protein 2 [Mya arenaria]WAR24544.1 hypothetical protein MAR_038213 [Mya arenaria]
MGEISKGNLTMSNLNTEGYNKMDPNIQKFFSTENHGDFILKGLQLNFPAGVVLSMLFVLVLVMLHEGFTYWIQHKLEIIRSLKTFRSKNDQQAAESRFHLIATMNKLLTSALFYLMVLCLVSRNIWILVSAILGKGVGYLLLRPFVSAYGHVGFEKSIERRTYIEMGHVNGTVSGNNEELICPLIEASC